MPEMDPNASILVVEIPGQRRRELILDPEEPCTMGRSHDNSVPLSDPAVSRRHCQVIFKGDGYYVEDTGSRNGTMVNELILSGPHLLSSGDRIQLGSCRFHYEQEQASGPVQMTEAEKPQTVHALDMGTILGQSFDTTAQRKIEPRLSETSEIYQKLDVATTALMVHCGLKELQQKIVDLVGEILVPDRAALIYPEGEDKQLVVKAIYQGDGSTETDIRLSRSIALQALEQRKAVIVRDAQHDDRFTGQDSVILERIQSALCAPLWDDHQVIGILYADKRSPLLTYNEDHLRLLSLVAHLAAVKIRETEAQEELELRRQQEEELRNAAKMQQQFLPSVPLTGSTFTIAGSNVPCLGVGGDYFDYMEAEDGIVTLALGDVSGKGMSAALLMTNLHANVHAISETGLTLDAMATRLNKAMYLSTQGRRFVTLFLARYDPKTRRLAYVNAGHNRPMLRRKSTKVEELSVGGLMLGAFPEAEYETAEVSLEAGDLLLLYSDGITEAETPDGEFFGEERLEAFLHERCDLELEDFVKEVIDEVHRFSEPEPPNDDVTAMILRCL